MSSLVLRCRMTDTRIARSPAALPTAVALGTGEWTLWGSSTRFAGFKGILASPFTVTGHMPTGQRQRAIGANVHPAALPRHRSDHQAGAGDQHVMIWS